MRQVLFHISLKPDWLPANLPLYLFLLAVGFGLALLAHLLSRMVRSATAKEALRGAAVWLTGAAVVSAVAVFVLIQVVGIVKLPIYGFGMMLFLAFIICTRLADRRAESEGVSGELIQDVAIWLFIGGLIGARLTFLRFEKHMSFQDMLSEFYRIWDGGIVLYGSVIGGLIAYLCFYAYLRLFRNYRLPTRQLADILAPSIAVGLCLGRMGCFLNGCCYGQVACPTCPVYAVHFPLSAPAREGLVEQGYQTPAGFTLASRQPSDVGARVGKVDPHSLAYEAGLRDGDLILRVNDCDIFEKDDEDSGKTFAPVVVLTRYLISNWPRGETQMRLTVRHDKDSEAVVLPAIAPRTLGVHPTQLYEVVSMALLFLVLTAYYPLRRRPGQVMAVLMAGYGVHRYLNELLRDDPRPQGLESYTSIFLIAAGIVLWLCLQMRRGNIGESSKNNLPILDASTKHR
jgi:phosphatidylglycerol:prolipoprotein diacylglycerol transferase